METSRILLIVMAIIAFVFALLVLLDLSILWRNRTITAHTTERRGKHNARVTHIQYILLLILGVITGLLIFSLVVLTSHGGYSTPCVIILSISLICVNNYQVRDESII
jgi:uncharacterized membrane protein